MNDQQPWQFTCKTCDSHNLPVAHVWSLLTGPDDESWQEWEPLEADHLWHYDNTEKMEKEEGHDDEVERGDFSEFAEDDSDSEPEEYEIFEQEGDPVGDEFHVNCASYDGEIEFVWSQPDRYEPIFTVECSDFLPAECWLEPRPWDSWQQKHWLRRGIWEAVANEPMKETVPNGI